MLRLSALFKDLHEEWWGDFDLSDRLRHRPAARRSTTWSFTLPPADKPVQARTTSSTAATKKLLPVGGKEPRLSHGVFQSA